MSQISKTLFQTGDINIFALLDVFYSRCVQIKTYFSDKKTSVVKSETQFRREAIKN